MRNTWSPCLNSINNKYSHPGERIWNSRRKSSVENGKISLKIPYHHYSIYYSGWLYRWMINLPSAWLVLLAIFVLARNASQQHTCGPRCPRKIKEVGDFSIKHTLVGGIPTPLKNDGVRQLGSWNSQLFLESHKTNVPVTTNQIRFILQEFRHWLCLKSRIAMDPPWTLVFFGHLEYPLVI